MGVWTKMQSQSSTITPATSSTLGGVKVGTGLSVDSNGVLSLSGSTGGSGSYNPNTWSGKVWNAMGDSITAYQYAGINYTLLIKPNLGFSTINNYGIAGNTIANTGGMADRITTMSTTCDLITVFGGTNDFGSNIALGVFTDRAITTFYGALHSMCINMLTTYPNSKYALITPSPRATGKTPNTQGLVLSDYADAMKKVGEYYSIPVLDLNRKAGFDPSIDIQKTTYTQDGIHMVAAGGQRIAKVIENFLLGI
jgi:lysophospholipase L1-like esterase